MPCVYMLNFEYMLLTLDNRLEKVMTAMEKVTKARSSLILDAPFFGSLLLRLKMIEDNSIDTMATNGKVIKFSSAFVLSISMDNLKGVLIHEILHCTFEHMARRNNRNMLEWNRACDYAINPIVFESGFKLPSGVLFETEFKGKSADEIYSDLQGQKQSEQGQNSQSDSNGSNSGSDNDNSSQGENTQNNDQNGKNSQNSTPQGNSGKDSGQDQQWQIGGIEDTQDENGNISTQANDEMAQQWRIATIQAYTQCKAMGGKIPSAIDRLVNEIKNPRIDWKETLRRFVSSNARNDYTWSVPNRRHIGSGLYLPEIKSEELGKIVLAIDTSGSISANDLDQFASELSDILESYNGIELTVIYCDTEIANVQEFTSDDLPLQLDAKGFGGTDFRPPFNWIEENGIEPICMIYFTDGYCNRYPMEPDYPVLWIGTVEFQPRFGDFAYLY